MLGNFSCILSYTDFFSKSPLVEILPGISSDCQTVWIKIRLNVLSAKGYQHMTLEDKEIMYAWLMEM